ncbi:HEAT repeat domain-containing protein [Archangium sp.]|uniref:HEAT repeat domain-containing protein n=1 Tax=Archangium sp. TaxID=1872627 RepID=UPI002D384503|nr:HEAT repeat domain-containing protein [Archangium sp.]HYO53585.1 HEAT repeat domain-containing protein [Archangium sp.]
MTEIHRLADRGEQSVEALIGHLTEPSWAVRRAVVAALARLGRPAVGALCELLVSHRDDEARLAATVDALVASRARVEEPVLSLARHDNPAIVCDAAQILGRRKSKEAIPVLRELIEHPDDNVAVAAIESLGRIGGADAVESLLTVLSGDNFFRTFPALEVLGRTGDARAIEPLAALLDNPLYAQDAARALGRLGDTGAVPALAKLLARRTDALVRAGALALHELRSHYLARYGTANAVEHALRSSISGQAEIRRITQAVVDASPAEQEALCQVLGWLKGEAAGTALLALLDSTPAAAAEALTHLGHEIDSELVEVLRSGDSARRLLLLPLIVGRKSALDECILCLEDPNPAVRVAACDAIIRIMDPTAVPALFKHLGDPDPRVSQAVTGAIQSLGSAQSERLAIEAAGSPDPRVRYAAIRIISYFGFPSGLQVLQESVRSSDERLREIAIQGLPYMDDSQALETLLEVARYTSYRTRAAAMRALGQTQPERRVIQALRAGLHDPDAWVRYYACQSLGKLGDEFSAPELVRLMDDPAGQVRAAVVDALSRLRAPEAFEALTRATTSSDPDLQRAALMGLGISRHPGALPLLARSAASRDPATRLIALSALAELDSPQVLPVLAKAAADPDESVRNAAIGHLESWRGPGATQVLLGLLPHVATQERVLAALSTPEDGRVPSLLGALELADEATAPLLASALARMHRPDAIAALVTALGLTSGAPGRRAAAAALAAIDTPEARRALARLADDPDLEVRRFASPLEH